jgi:hypothetical protein
MGDFWESLQASLLFNRAAEKYRNMEVQYRNKKVRKKSARARRQYVDSLPRAPPDGGAGSIAG